MGFYSAFMVGKKVRVVSRAFGSDGRGNPTASRVIIEEAERAEHGTDVIVPLKDDTDDENYDHYATKSTA